METKDGIKTIEAKNRAAWRKWLAANHEKEKSVWLIMYNKASGKPSINWDEAVTEALCFGWIDSKSVKRDEVSRYQFYTKRKPNSRWSRINKNKAEQLVKEGLMQPAGLKAVEIAKQNGTWTILDEVEDLVLPDDFIKELKKHKAAAKNFEAFPSSARKIVLAWIMSAKRPETRRKRIEEAASLAAKNIRAQQYTPKKS